MMLTTPRDMKVTWYLVAGNLNNVGSRTPAECSVAKNTFDWPAKPEPFMIGRQIQGFL